ncbi:unnamed protein product [Caenorhabditis angaria]|uniref:Rhodanese domain-containing protein n=1 Tax=Caenorhabditis angaria TaxID=860376 RepID=A0A9P1N3W9_9PELO|nr:unnamed protein product [Caenorhabditis angaria]
MPGLKKIIDVAQVNTLLQRKLLNSNQGVRLLDCSYALAPRQDWRQFEKESYAKFDLDSSSPSRKLYLSAHIPQARRFFEKYAQKLGLNAGEHLIFYGKGAFGGMLFASKCAWLFKSYGHENISLVDGGFDGWKRAGFEVSQEDLRLQPGNWKAQNAIEKHVITYEELETKENGSEKQNFEKSDEFNFLDSRGRGQFEGTEDTGLDPNKVNGTRIAGFKNFPSAELLQKPGILKSEDEIRQWFNKNGYNPSLPTVTSCNSGVQAALLAFVMDWALPESRPRLFNGSLKEVELRDPKKISEGPQHLPH